MNWLTIKYMFLLLSLLLLPLPAKGADTTSVSRDTLGKGVYVEVPRKISRYDIRQHRYRKYWAALIPTQWVVQYAGNMGLFSTGIGWDYGRHRQFETHFMVGFIPRNSSRRPKMTLTLKENYIPWSLHTGHGFAIEPLSTGFYVNSVMGHEFWDKQPVRYESGYYTFSTKLHFNLFVGERLTKLIPNNRRLLVKSVTAFYEISSPDLYIITKIKNSSVSLYDILCLSLGVKFQLL